MMTQTPQRRLIKLPIVEQKVGHKKAWIYARIREGEFPRQVPIGPGSVAWVESEIDEWVEARIAERDRAQVVT